MLREALKSTGLRHVATLVTGTTLAQCLPVLASPVLTRIYSPENFGLLGVFTAVTMTLSVLVTGRYQLAIVLPEHDEDAVNLVGLSLFLSLVTSLIALVAVALLNAPISSILNSPEISSWLYLVPLSLFFTGVYQTFTYWCNRKQHYGFMATSRVLQSVVLTATSLAFGIFALRSSGLILALIFGQATSACFLLFISCRRYARNAGMLTWSHISAVAKRYRGFPLFSVPADTINNASRQMPVILLTTFFGPVVAGFYTLTQRALAAPSSMIAMSVGDVFKQRASVQFARHGNCRSEFLRTFKLLTILAVFPFMATALAGPWLFEFVFGPEWRTAGEYARILSPLYFLGFIASPLSKMFYVAEKQAYDLVWQVSLFVVTTTGMFIGYLVGSPSYSIACFCGAYGGMYVAYLAMAYRFTIAGALNRDIPLLRSGSRVLWLSNKGK